MKSIQYIWQRQNWPQLTWDAEKFLCLLGECRQLQGGLLGAVAALGFDLENQAQAEFFTEEILQTSAIEGEQLDVRSVRSSVARKLGLSAAGLPVDQRIDNLMAVLLDATRNHSAPLTPERLCGWHAALFPTGYSGFHKIQVGAWRKSPEPMRVVSGPVGKERIHYEAPPAASLDDEMNRFFFWWNESQGTIEGIIRAAIAHFRFVAIHPFDDGKNIGTETYFFRGRPRGWGVNLRPRRSSTPLMKSSPPQGRPVSVALMTVVSSAESGPIPRYCRQSVTVSIRKQLPDRTGFFSPAIWAFALDQG